MKKLIIILTWFVALTFQNQAQTVTFSKVYSEDVQGYAMVRTFDNNYMIAGEKLGNPLVLKIDTTGNILWDKMFENSTGSNFNSIVRTNDSCYVIAGNIYNSVDSASNIFYVKINSNGDTLWAKEIDMGYDDYVNSLQMTYDNGFILTGYVQKDPNSITKIAVVKLNDAGDLQWGRIISGSNNNYYAYSIKQMPDSGFVLTGYKDSLSNYFTVRALLMKLSPVGEIAWTKEDTSTSKYYSSVGEDVLMTSTGLTWCLQNGYIILMKTDFSGNILWCRNTEIFGNGVNKLYPTSDNGYTIVTEAMALIKIDSVGNTLWSYNFNLNSVNDFVGTQDKGLIVLGNGPIIGTKGWGSQEIGMIKTDSTGYSKCSDGFSNSTVSVPIVFGLSSPSVEISSAGKVVFSHPVISDATLYEIEGCVDFVGQVKENILKQDVLNVYPNPASNKFTIEMDNLRETYTLEILNTVGQVVLNKQITNPVELVDLTGQAAGVYFVKVQTENNTVVKKIIKE